MARRRPYGTHSIYQRKSDGRWIGSIEAGWTKTGARRRVSVTAKTEAEVKRKLKLRAREIAEGNTDASERTTVKTWAAQWLAMTERTARPKTHTTDRGAVGKWIIPTIGHKRLDRLSPADVRAVTNAVRASGLSTTTAHAYHGTLRRMLKAAVEDGHRIPSNTLTVKPPQVAVHDRQAMPLPHALAVLSAATALPHASRWAAALLQGMRQGECLGLTWPEVSAGSLAVSWQLQALPYIDPKDKGRGFRIPDGYEARRLEHAYHLVRPKSKAGWRVIPLVPWMRNALDAWREVAPDSPHDLVWPNLKGAPANPRQDVTEWQAIQDAADVRHPSGRWYHLHEARHTAATILMELGVEESVRIAILGHSSITVSRGYEFVDTAQTRLALERMAERLELR